MPSPIGLRLNGSNVLPTIFLDSTRYPQSQVIKTVNIEPQVQRFEDAFLGDDADRPDLLVRGYVFKFDAFVVDHVLMKALLAREAARIARQRMAVLAIVLAFQNRDGSTDLFRLQECEMPPFTTNVTGKNERIMHDVQGFARYYRPVGA